MLKCSIRIHFIIIVSKESPKIKISHLLTILDANMMFISNLGWISVQLEGFVGTFEVSVQEKASISILSRKKYRLATLTDKYLDLQIFPFSIQDPMSILTNVCMTQCPYDQRSIQDLKSIQHLISQQDPMSIWPNVCINQCLSKTRCPSTTQCPSKTQCPSDPMSIQEPKSIHINVYPTQICNISVLQETDQQTYSHCPLLEMLSHLKIKYGSIAVIWKGKDEDIL